MVFVISTRSDLSAVPVKSPVTLPVICPVTPRVPPIVVLFVTSRVPRVEVPVISALPVVEWNVTLSVLLPFCNIRVLDAPRRTILSLKSDVLFCVIVPLKVELPSTFRVVSKSTAPVTLRSAVTVVFSSTSSVPSITVLPVAEATVNLVLLIAKLPPTVKVESSTAVEDTFTDDNDVA